MRPSYDFLHNQLQRLKNASLGNHFRIDQIDDELPFRAELFSASQMEQHGCILANAHKLSTTCGRDQLLYRLAENEEVILDACNQLTEAIKSGRQITPAAEWLLDNFYLIEEHIRIANRHLPRNYSKQLPSLLVGTSVGMPRVYDIALETISHGDGRIDPEGLSGFVSAYQQVTTLKLGELWAIPIMLRLALIENLRRISARLAITLNKRKLAYAWAEKLTETAEKDPNNLVLVVADMARSSPPVDSAFVAELVRRLHGQGPALTLPLSWLSQRLAETGQTIENLVQFESQHQAADQVSISNSIASLRVINSMDWREFVESMSVIEHVLRRDPVDVYAKMDFATRDNYRHAVEKIARYSRLSEVDIATIAIDFANANKTRNVADERTKHVGYFLIDRGHLDVERSAGFQAPPIEKLRRIGGDSPLIIYLTSIMLLTVIVTGFIADRIISDKLVDWMDVMLLLMAFIASSQLALALVNWLATLIVQPSPLPRMDFSKGIPLESSSVVVIPSMLFTKFNIDSLTEALELRFLANQDRHLRFCLLTDFSDAASETMPGDAMLLQQISQNIEQLNQKYKDNQNQDGNLDNFLLLHRPRSWNPQEKIWMGYERKRGKLGDLNNFFRASTGAEKAFSLIVGNTDDLINIRYVITLDVDTELPRDAAKKFIATMAHPLNRPRYDENHQRVCGGYGILQPRVSVSLPGTNASRFELLCGGDIGIDPYTRSVSDVYQDIFGEGSFIGKGIYEIDAFESALKGRMPENRILSHDLLEGCYARAGLLSDVQLYERHPSSYSADISRRHRWIRGDWQIASWLLPRVPGNRDPLTGKIIRYRNPLSSLSRWKLFDNLRRSMVPIALTFLMLGGWIWLAPSWFWTGVAIVILFLPATFTFIFDLLHKPRDMLYIQHFFSMLQSTRQHYFHALLTLSFLPYEAAVNLDAILRTQWRIHISRKQLLEWNPSSESNRQRSNGLLAYWQSMWIASVTAIFASIYLAINMPTNLPSAMPVLLLWLISPFLAYWISQPIKPRAVQLTEEQIQFLRSLARKTWFFFETYVSKEDHYLPLDNVQEYPVAVVARRTSPTNIGMLLLSNVAAYDFGYITAGELITRSKNTLQTMSKLERYQGHFYNWYDTESLKPLHPLYVSAVDSGNLAGHLLTLRPALIDIADAPIITPKIFFGIRDTYQILIAMIDDISREKLLSFKKDLDRVCHEQTDSLIVTFNCLDRLNHCAENFLAHIEPTPPSRLRSWALALTSQCRVALNEIHELTPWVAILTATNGISELPALTRIPTLRGLAQLHSDLMRAEEKTVSGSSKSEEKSDISTLMQAVREGSRGAAERLLLIDKLVLQTAEFAHMEFDFLYEPATHLLAIGYNVTDRRLDVSSYDLLASEARLATFVTIAQGQLPQESWFALGRQLTIAGAEPILLSWSGSMFEYLMPLLVMPTFNNTLLDQTYRSAVQRHIAYGSERGVPWGISESGYNAFDVSLNYQYRAFGVPGLGFKRGLGDDLVVAPYASMMALMVNPEEACKNLQELSRLGFEGDFGFYEAIDYTPSRLPRGQNNAVIRSFMTHHQGMGFLSLAYLLLDRPMQSRFESDPLFRATMPLLHERIPKATANYSNTTELADIRIASTDQKMQMRVLQRPDPRIPEVQLLSNGQYHMMITSAGGSYSRWNDIAITRWREDGTRDNWGAFCYVREIDNGQFWSTAFQPTLARPDNYEVIFSEGRAEFRRNDNNFNMHTEIVVSPEDDIELRRTRIVNRSPFRRTIDLTSYAEVVLASAAADASHPAFGNLFIQTEIVQSHRAILCSRRSRSKNEKNPWMFHLISVHGVEINVTSYETDRMHFIGRGNTLVAPHAMIEPGPLTNSQGSVLDPIVAIRTQITLDPEQSASFDIVTGIAESREVCLDMIEKYQDHRLADRVIELSWTQSQVMLRQLNASDADAQLYARLASSVIYVNAQLRADASILIRNHRGQSGLWSSAISGDLPIVLVQIKSLLNIELVRQLVQAHSYWRSKGLVVDLVIWNEEHNGYRQSLQEQILRLISSVTGMHTIDRPGGIFVRISDQISNEDRILFQSVARVILSDSRGTLSEQINRRELTEVRMPRLVPSFISGKKLPLANQETDIVSSRSDLILSNGIGGFTPDGQEYVITTSGNQLTPAPWSNVIANKRFGSVISESGQAYTWGENAHEFRLTPWANDPVSDLCGEVFYLRDEETGRYWSPTPLPCRGEGEYVTRHGFGYSAFEHTENGIFSELIVYVALDDPIKYSVLRIKNNSPTRRKLSVTGYVEWVLGDLRPKSTMHIVTEIEPTTNTLCARNPYNTEFPQRTAFFDLDSKSRTLSCDRNEFIGRNRSLNNPVAMERICLSGKIGAGLDPCAAIQTQFELAQGEQREIVFMLGMAESRQSDVSQLVQRYRGTNAAHETLSAVHAYWNRTLSAIRIETPDPALNVMANGWLMYQTIACRLWARSGYYQSGGAYGFRDQLQDTMALVHTEPALIRDHLLLCAAHQFIEGDVQHWWHPPTDRGVRTHCSDDYLWLPLAVHRYVTCTGDTGVLNEMVRFIEGRPLNHDEDSYYDLPSRSEQNASLYEHCVRAIERGLNFGSHGLSLIGSCDWNDGMDKVGEQGKGESVWLSFFLYEVLMNFADVATSYNDLLFSKRCQSEASKLRQQIESHAWDGEWYRRAYFDDGTPLGSAQNVECQIDSISQSWSVLSGAGDPDRTRQAMQAADRRLVKNEEAFIQLLDPPFDKSNQHPGYIRGYVPGVRENGGQYTHAAIWLAMAFIKMDGDADKQRAWDLMRMINPVNHGKTASGIAKYKVEPYVIAADVYAVSPHVGRGGWTWYTGSSGWMYRLIIESLLGIRLESDELVLTPCLPKDWSSYRMQYRYRETIYKINVERSKVHMTENKIMLDGIEQADGIIPLLDDKIEHEVSVYVTA